MESPFASDVFFLFQSLFEGLYTFCDLRDLLSHFLPASLGGNFLMKLVLLINTPEGDYPNRLSVGRPAPLIR